MSWTRAGDSAGQAGSLALECLWWCCAREMLQGHRKQALDGKRERERERERAETEATEPTAATNAYK